MIFLAQTTRATSLLDIVTPLIPWLMVFGFVFFVVSRMQRRQSATAADQIARARAHWEKVEAKLDRLIDLLEQQNHGK